jgi:hypothetical protein
LSAIDTLLVRAKRNDIRLHLIVKRNKNSTRSIEAAAIFNERGRCASHARC